LRVEKAILGKQMKRMKLDAPGSRSQGAPEKKMELLPSVMSVEEEMLLLFLHKPSDSMGGAISRVDWQDARCREVWDIVRTKKDLSALQVAEVLSQVSEGAKHWLSERLMQEREYARPETVMAELVESWGRAKETRDWQDLKREIDDMIDGRIPLDNEKILAYNTLSRRLKGSRPDSEIHTEAPLHG
jgi:hypothetical protein